MEVFVMLLLRRTLHLVHKRCCCVRASSSVLTAKCSRPNLLLFGSTHFKSGRRLDHLPFSWLLLTPCHDDDQAPPPGSDFLVRWNLKP